MENREIMEKIDRGSRQIGRVVLALLIGVMIGFVAHIVISSQMAKMPKDEIIIADTTIAEDGSILSISTVEEIVERVGDLVTTRYSYKDADMSEDFKEIKGVRIPFTSNKVVFTYRGTVGLGMNLKDVEYQIDNDAKRISITLPEMGIVFNEIDHGSFDIPYESKPLFNRNDMKDYMELINTLQEQKALSVMEDKELISNAENNAKEIIKGFLTSADATKDYEVIIR